MPRLCVTRLHRNDTAGSSRERHSLLLQASRALLSWIEQGLLSDLRVTSLHLQKQRALMRRQTASNMHELAKRAAQVREHLDFQRKRILRPRSLAPRRYIVPNACVRHRERTCADRTASDEFARRTSHCNTAMLLFDCIALALRSSISNLLVAGEQEGFNIRTRGKRTVTDRFCENVCFEREEGTQRKRWRGGKKTSTQQQEHLTLAATFDIAVLCRFLHRGVVTYQMQLK